MKFISTVLLLSIFFCNVDCGTLELPVYTQTLDLERYYYKTDLPQMSQSTICFWMATGADDRSSDFFISLFTDHNSNELMVYFSNDNLVFNVRGNSVTMSPGADVMLELWTKWHKHCITWELSGPVSWYADKTVPGELELIDTQTIGANDIRCCGTLTILQEQDSELGSFDLSQTVPGKLTWFNWWNYAMTESQVNAIRCRDEGNVVSPKTLHISLENVAMHYERFPCLDDEMDVLPKLHTEKNKNMIFCKIMGASLANHDISTSEVTNHRRCLTLCIGSENCISANYRVSTRACTLSDSIDQDNTADFDPNLSDDYLHFTSRECAD